MELGFFIVMSFLRCHDLIITQLKRAEHRAFSLFIYMMIARCYYSLAGLDRPVKRWTALFGGALSTQLILTGVGFCLSFARS
jgi:hypothetical protein